MVDTSFPAATLSPGPNTLTFDATDMAGNVTATTVTITLVIPSDPTPVVHADIGREGLEAIGFQTNIVAITGTFTSPQGVGPYSASVRWDLGGNFTPLILNNNHEFIAAWVYGKAGSHTVTVKICDAQGRCGTDDLTVHTKVTQRITPVLQCVIDRGATTTPRYQAVWGYNNPAPFVIVAPSIPLLDNTFTTAPFLAGQPQLFLPGAQRDVFTTTFSSGSKSWRLNGITASATTGSPRCT